jgi:hypothetical protein
MEGILTNSKSFGSNSQIFTKTQIKTEAKD